MSTRVGGHSLALQKDLIQADSSPPDLRSLVDTDELTGATVDKAKEPPSDATMSKVMDLVTLMIDLSKMIFL